MRIPDWIILNGISPTYGEVYQDWVLLLGFLLLTIIVEAGAFWFIFEEKFTGDEAKWMFFKMIVVIAVLNFLTFLIGAAIYLAVR